MTKNKDIYLASKPRYEILDGLRGVAALLVVFFHCFETYIPAIWHAAHQPWLPGGGLLLRALGLRHRICLRRQMGEDELQELL